MDLEAAFLRRIGHVDRQDAAVLRRHEQQVAERTPDDIEVIIDDDIVAKQLREAALAEDDPELRERLWDEYRKYKGM